EQERVELGVDQVIDPDDLDVGRALDESPERLATDPAEAVDPDPNGHRRFLPWASRSCGLSALIVSWGAAGGPSGVIGPDVGRSVPACQSYDADGLSGHPPASAGLAGPRCGVP